MVDGQHWQFGSLSSLLWLLFFCFWSLFLKPPCDPHVSSLLISSTTSKLLQWKTLCRAHGGAGQSESRIQSTEGRAGIRGQNAPRTPGGHEGVGGGEEKGGGETEGRWGSLCRDRYRQRLFDSMSVCLWLHVPLSLCPRAPATVGREGQTCVRDSESDGHTKTR